MELADQQFLPGQKRYGNLEKNYLKMGEKTPQQEIVELKAALRAANAENKTLKYIMEIIQEEYGEEVVKKYLPGLQLKKPARRRKQSQSKGNLQAFRDIVARHTIKRSRRTAEIKKQRKRLSNLLNNKEF